MKEVRRVIYGQHFRAPCVEQFASRPTTWDNIIQLIQRQLKYQNNTA